LSQMLLLPSLSSAPDAPWEFARGGCLGHLPPGHGPSYGVRYRERNPSLVQCFCRINRMPRYFWQ
jgi:hypothetical protein